MSTFNLSEQAHRRYNPLTGEWLLVSPHRTKRPWQGKEEKPIETKSNAYDAACYLCPGNTRNNGTINPNYTGTFVFDNDFAALPNDKISVDFNEGLLQAKSETGICRVLCFSPNHSLTLAQMNEEDILKVVNLWINEYRTLGNHSFINHVQIFENKGEMMGCSNPHPHGQIWAQSSIPNEVLKKSKQQLAYFEKHNKTLLADYLEQELQQKERTIFENEHFVALVPFWAVWPYETMLVPKASQSSILKMNESQRAEFASSIKRLTATYDKLFQVSFPYSSGIHQAPTDGKEHLSWHWHMSFYPPLLRSATVKKFMVGYEMFGEPQRDITAEMAAYQLRKLVG